MAKRKGHTIAELSRRFQASEQTIRNFATQCQPLGKSGRSKTYDWQEVKAAMDARRPKAKNGELGKLEQEKIKLQIRKLEIDVETQEGKLLPIDEVKREFVKFCEFVNVHLGRMGRDLGVELEGKSAIQIQQAIEDHNDRLISKLSDTPYK